jgi:hypothetical protein
MTSRSVLITGASGYMYVINHSNCPDTNASSGGAVLAEILQSKNNSITVSALVRSAAHRDAVRLLGVTPIHFDGLHDLETIRQEAAKHDSKKVSIIVLDMYSHHGSVLTSRYKLSSVVLLPWTCLRVWHSWKALVIARRQSAATCFTYM